MIKTNFSTGFISGLHDFTPYFHFRCVAHANLIHSADVCSLLMACVGYACARAAKNPQNSFTFASFFLTQMYFYPVTTKSEYITKTREKIVCHV